MKPSAAVLVPAPSEPGAKPAFDRAAWRTRREAKRQRQRVESVVRAKDMHAARISAGAAGGKPAEASPKPKLFVGCSGWFYWHWRSAFYPGGTKTGAWFDHYAKTFHTVELNAPFYSWPKVSTVQGWRRQVGRRNFTYTVKVSELITHVNASSAPGGWWRISTTSPICSAREWAASCSSSPRATATPRRG